MFDWLRMVYDKMRYYVRHGDMHSEIFKALIGLLTGDPVSPILWNLFLSDLSMMPDMDDSIPQILSEIQRSRPFLLLGMKLRGMLHANDPILIVYIAPVPLLRGHCTRSPRTNPRKTSFGRSL
jgi:hypothetical protein